MKYTVTFTKEALKQLKKMDKASAALILGWIRKNLEGCDNPRIHGKGLTANRSGQWRYRVGDYRIIAEIYDDKVVILVLNIGHRRDVYG
ncbi:type II toxin-antitoxin system RelE family toxin [Oribacterium sp. NK2B42]|uniref:type II toxin-antitoxin system RelE family toxin n=1 Tax=Oribacterium sp. NK2B42 TaxID=689781 RepID=UPI00040372D1|nr:type II toxin-antitoxin system RelE/ParE family toxin [Oribacterium sp. NK2B42]MBO6308764.1 type II toxin-antitoxin system RelE/ParE family toxin [Oribacterium sp.]MBP3804199.1 type II toxin-antitoxin system RelE/ParE family toxin [Oribacterium sp.]